MTTAWPILPDPLTPSMSIVVVHRSETGRAIDTAGIVGRGILRPFRRDQKRDFANGTGVELVAAELGQVLGTICASEDTGGELPWRTEFGSLLHLLRLNNLSPVLVEKARAFVAGAVRRWLPRVRLTQVQIVRTDIAGKLVIRFRWALTGIGSEKVVVSGLETEIAVG